MQQGSDEGWQLTPEHGNKAVSVDPPFGRQQFYHVQEALKSGFCPPARGERPAVKALSGREVPLSTDAEIATAAERRPAFFTFATLDIHGSSPVRNCIFLTTNLLL